MLKKEICIFLIPKKYLHLAALVQHDLQIFIHWWPWLPCKVPTSTSGAIWGSASCPRTLRHADQGNWTSNLVGSAPLPYLLWSFGFNYIRNSTKKLQSKIKTLKTHTKKLTCPLMICKKMDSFLFSILWMVKVKDFNLSKVSHSLNCLHFLLPVTLVPWMSLSVIMRFGTL